MLKKVLIFLFLILAVMQFVLAAETDIKIKTPPFTEVHLTVLNPDADFDAYKSYKNISNAYGDIEFVYSGSELVFDLMVVLKKSDQTIYSNKFRENYIAGEPISLEIVPDGYELRETPKISAQVTGVDEGTNVTNVSESSSETSSAKTSEEKTGKESPKNKSNFLSSFWKSELGQSKPDNSSKVPYYIIGAILFLAIVYFVFRNYYSPSPRKIKVTKLSDVQAPKVIDSKSVNELIGNATDRIRAAQREIDTLKKYR